MSHNTFTHSNENGIFYCQSHNFPEIKGQGKNETQAMNDMVNKIQELQTILGNKVFVKKILDRIARGLECECGEPLNDLVVGYKI